MSKNFKISLVLSVLFIGLVRFRPLWERYPGGLWNLFFFLGIAVLFVVLSIKLIREIAQIFKKRSHLTFHLVTPSIVIGILLFDGLFNPLKLDLDKMYGRVDFQACYEGTQNQAVFKFREGGSFDIHWTGVFFYDQFFTGQYIKKGDTLLLDFDTKPPGKLSDTILVAQGTILSLKSDTLIPTNFYLGHCKGLN